MIGIALGGGGARGAAHLGVLQHLSHLNIKIGAYAGTSAGSIIAALAAFNVPLEEAQSAIGNLKPAQFTALRWGNLGLLHNDAVRQLLIDKIGENKDIGDAFHPLAIHVTDSESGKGVVLTAGPVIDAVLASCCVPGIYIPPLIKNKIYVDGGLTENVPLSALRALKAKTTIGVNLNGQSQYPRPESPMDVLMNAMDIAIDSQTRQQLKAFDLVVSMDLTSYSRTSSKATDELVAIGRQTAQRQIPSRFTLTQAKVQHRLGTTYDLFSPIKLPEFLKNIF